MALASAAGAAIGGGVVGYKVGSAVGDWIEQPGSSATGFKTGLGGGVSGAASGAAAGFAIGGPAGAIIGAIVGGIAGAVGGSGAERRREDAQSSQEQAETDAARPAAIENAAQASQVGTQLLPQFKALHTPETLPLLAQSIAQSPQAQQVMAQTVQTLRGLGNQWNSQPVLSLWGTDNVDFSPTQQGIGNFLTLLEYIATNGAQLTDPAQIAFAESPAGLIRSGETGKFGPGVEIMKVFAQRLQVAQAALQSLLRL